MERRGVGGGFGGQPSIYWSRVSILSSRRHGEGGCPHLGGTSRYRLSRCCGPGTSRRRTPDRTCGGAGGSESLATVYDVASDTKDEATHSISSIRSPRLSDNSSGDLAWNSSGREQSAKGSFRLPIRSVDHDPGGGRGSGQKREDVRTTKRMSPGTAAMGGRAGWRERGEEGAGKRVHRRVFIVDVKHRDVALRLPLKTRHRPSVDGIGRGGWLFGRGRMHVLFFLRCTE